MGAGVERGGVEPVFFSPELRSGISELAIEAIAIASEALYDLPPQYEQPEDKYPPELSSEKTAFPYLALRDGWQEDDVYGDIGMRLPNPEYEGLINRNTIIHLPDTVSRAAQLPSPLDALAKRAVDLARLSKEELAKSHPDIGLEDAHSTTRVIMYPREIRAQQVNSEGGQQVALKTHVDKCRWTVTRLETGPGFEYKLDTGEYAQPDPGSYLFASGTKDACEHRVNHDIVATSEPHKDLDSRLSEALDSSPFVRLADIQFFR